MLNNIHIEDVQMYKLENDPLRKKILVFKIYSIKFTLYDT